MKVLLIGFGEGLLGSITSWKLRNEDGEINWALAIGEGTFPAVMAGMVWRKTDKTVKINTENSAGF